MAEARATTTSAHLESAARALRTAGAVLMALLVWLVAGTALVAAHGADGRAAQAVAPTRSLRVADGDPIARITARRADVAFTVLQGTGPASLDRGVGHPASSAVPGAAGNAIVVGHRVLSGRPLGSARSLRRGDLLRVRTPWGAATYRVRSVGQVPRGGADLRPAGRARLTILTGSRGTGLTQVSALLVGRPIPRAPAPAPGYPAVPGADLAALVAAALWGLLAAGAWRARTLFTRTWGSLAGGLAVSPLVAVFVLLAFVAVGHALPGTL